MTLDTVLLPQDSVITYGYNNYNNDYDYIDGSAAHHASSSSRGNILSVSRTSTRKRRRRKSMEKEAQRMTHITVERNRRRQMSEYLTILRSLMPASYAQRGDQASIVGGAINYVKELEHLLQFLESHKAVMQQERPPSDILSKFFTFPQFTTSSMYTTSDAQPGIANIEVTMAENHANIKILMLRRTSKLLLKMANAFQSINFTILHLNITSFDESALYSFTVKVEDECQLTTVNEIANAVHELVGMIHEESMSRRDNPPHNSYPYADGIALSNLD